MNVLYFRKWYFFKEEVYICAVKRLTVNSVHRTFSLNSQYKYARKYFRFLTMEQGNKALSITEIKKALSDSLKLLREMKSLCNRSLQEGDHEKQMTCLKQCESLKSRIEEETQIVVNPSKKTAAVNKLLRMERKKRWKLKSRRLSRVKRSFYRTMIMQRNK